MKQISSEKGVYMDIPVDPRELMTDQNRRDLAGAEEISEGPRKLIDAVRDALESGDIQQLDQVLCEISRASVSTNVREQSYRGDFQTEPDNTPERHSQLLEFIAEVGEYGDGQITLTLADGGTRLLIWVDGDKIEVSIPRTHIWSVPITNSEYKDLITEH